MSEREQIEAFADEIDKLVERFSLEFDLSRASAVGVLHMKATMLCFNAAIAESED